MKKYLLFALMLIVLVLTSCEKEGWKSHAKRTFITESHIIEMEVSDSPWGASEGTHMESFFTGHWEDTGEESFFKVNAIEGFTFEEGYIYTLYIEILRYENPPSEMYPYKYKLIRIKSKTKA